MSHLAAIAVLCIATAGVAAQWLAWRYRLPAIVLLFAVGLVVGPGLHILDPATAFGPALHPLVGLAVAVIVFEGGLALDVRELRAASEGVLRLTVVAVPISFVLAAAAAHLCADMPWGVAALFGAVTVVTGPTVVLPLLRHTRLERRAASLLKWEAIVNDPVGALMSAIILALLVAEGTTPGAIVSHLALGLLVAAALGVGTAWGIGWLVRQDRLPEVLKTPILLAATLSVTVLANLVVDEAGLAAATILGVALANFDIPGIRELARFKESLVVLIVSALFIVLTAGLDRSVFAQLSAPILLLTGAMLFLVRPLTVALATLGSDIPWQERVLVGWIAPRGIVAAAVAGVASTKLAAAGIDGGDRVMPAVFALIAVTMVAHGFSLSPLARHLRLTLGSRPVVAIVGATTWSINLAKTLVDLGAPVLVIDTFPGALARARELDVPVLQAEILSAHGEEELTDRRVDYLLAATSNDIYNSLVCARLAPELGRRRVFQLAPAGGDIDEWAGLDREWRGQILGVPPADFPTLRRRGREGSLFVVREVDPGHDDAPMDDTGDILVLAVRANGDIAFASTESAMPTLSAGDRLIYLAGAPENAGARAPAAVTAPTLQEVR